MSTPSTPDGWKSLRVTHDVHARLQRLSEGMFGASMNDVIAWLTSPDMVRVHLTPLQQDRWRQAADNVGMDVSNFVLTRVESAIAYGADPHALKHIYDVTLSIARQVGAPPPPQYVRHIKSQADPNT